MHRGEVHDKPRMLGAPSGDVFSRMCTDMIADEMNRPKARGNLLA
jgi:hypothetical protein